MTVVKQMALPVSTKVIFRLSSMLSPLFLANLNLLKKWMVSSTAIPKITAKTIEIPASNSIPTKPNNAPAISNGMIFGNREITNNLKFRNRITIKRLTITTAIPKPNKRLLRTYSAFCRLLNPFPFVERKRPRCRCWLQSIHQFYCPIL